MGTFSSLEEAREYFRMERFATSNGMTLEELSEERAVCALEVRENHLNALNGVMGGAIFTLADFASAALANHLHSPTVAQQVNINYLNGARGARLLAEATCLKNGRSTVVTEVDVRDDAGREIARCTVTGFKLSR